MLLAMVMPSRRACTWLCTQGTIRVSRRKLRLLLEINEMSDWSIGVRFCSVLLSIHETIGRESHLHQTCPGSRLDGDYAESSPITSQ